MVPAGGSFGLAWAGGDAVVAELPDRPVRWVWWSARQAAAAVLGAGVRPARCWDLGAVGRLLHGLRRDDPGAVWAAARGLPQPPPPTRGLDLLDLDGETGAPVRPDGHLSREWLRDPADPVAWARLALELQGEQEALARSLPDPRAASTAQPMALLTAYAESLAALLAVELERAGLPLDRPTAEALLREVVDDRLTDAQVLAHFPGRPVDLRSPAQVRELLTRVGLDLPDTRSWRLEPYADSSPAVAALLSWRKAERLATTYGWRWLDECVRGGRLRGAWTSAEGAGRMTAQSGLHNLPAELRPAVRAEPGQVLVRADLGQIEPRVLAVVSRDPKLTAAAAQVDLYAPVAAALRCERPAAKVAVLAAMYGQTSGTAGAALRDMDRAYPQAMAYLRAAEAAGLERRDVRTYGGRLLPLSSIPAGEPVGEHVATSSGSGRFARNAMVQGAAAELFKAWAATVRHGLPPLGGEIVLCLHDELLLHVPSGSAEAAAVLLHAALAQAAGWWAAGSGVRFVAEVSAGDSWAAAH